MRLTVATVLGLVSALWGAGVAGAQLPTVDDGFVNGADTYVFTRATHPKVSTSGTSDFRFHDNSGSAVTTTSARCYGVHGTSWDVVCALGPSFATIRLPGTGANTIDVSGAPVKALVEAGGGSDTVLGTPFSDEVYGQADGDTLRGNSGYDRLYGGGLSDFLFGGGDGDHLEGGIGNDHLHGENGSDSLFGQAEWDTLTGGDGEDHLEGGWGGDELDGGAEADYLDGDDFATAVNGGVGSDIIDGGPGVDEVIYDWRRYRVRVTLDGLRNDGEIFEADLVRNVENIRGGNGPDILAGDGNANMIYGGAGNDDVDGGAADDILLGEQGEDTIVGGPGQDLMLGEDDPDLIESRDGVVEAVGCGGGVDRVIADPDDVFPAGDCELVDWGQRQTVGLVGNPPEITEGSAGIRPATIEIALPVPSSIQRYVAWTLHDGTATSPADFQTASGLVSVPPWASRGTFTVDVAGDTMDEPAEAFEVQLRLLNAANDLLDERREQVTIVDDDPEPSLSVDDPSTDEAGKAGPMTFTVSLSEPSAKTVTVEYGTRNGTARGELKMRDYEPMHDLLTFAPGETAKQVDVVVQDDMAAETDETFELVLTNPTDGTLKKDVGTATIIDDDFPLASVTDASVTESPSGPSVGSFWVVLSQPSERMVSVDYATADASALAGSDYRALAQSTLSFAPGDDAMRLQVTVDDDALDENDETFELRLLGSAGGLIGDGTGIGTIVDNDPEPLVSASSPTVSEGNSGTKNFHFVVSLSQASGRSVRVDYATLDGTATAPSDYVATSGAVTFAPGETSKIVAVPVVGDSTLETHEDFYLTLSPVFASVLTDGRATILNDD